MRPYTLLVWSASPTPSSLGFLDYGWGRGAAGADSELSSSEIRDWLPPRSRRRHGTAGTDAREPHFVIANNDTFVFSFFQAGVDPLAFEPNGAWRTQTETELNCEARGSRSVGLGPRTVCGQ